MLKEYKSESRTRMKSQVGNFCKETTDGSISQPSLGRGWHLWSEKHTTGM